MTRILTLLYAVCLLLSTACDAPSIHPVYSASVGNADSDLVGVWKMEGETTTYEVVEAVGRHRYDLTVESNDANDATYHFELRTLKIDDHPFGDVMATEQKRSSIDEEHGLFFVPTHMFFRYKINDENTELSVWTLNVNWLRRGLSAGILDLEHTWLAGDKILITAPTKDLQEFIVAYADHKQAFDKKVLTRVE